MSANRARLWWWVKLAVAAAVVAGVAVHFARILGKPELHPYPFALRLEYLVPAGLLYLGAHTCWAWFWVRLLRSQGVQVSLLTGVRAYFVSQFGKYVPGKAWVILIRVGMLRGAAGATPLAVGVTATYETLTSMGAGALVGVLLLPWLGVLPEVVSGNIAWVVAVAGLPLGLGVLNKLVAKRLAESRGPDAPPLPSPPLGLLAQGLLHGAFGWCLLGVSLALTVRAVAPEPGEWELDALLADLGAVSLSYVAGFAVLLVPGGLGVRELILEAALRPQFAGSGDGLDGALAAVVALVLRLTWTVAELAFVLVLYLRRPVAAEPPSGQEPSHD